MCEGFVNKIKFMCVPHVFACVKYQNQYILTLISTLNYRKVLILSYIDYEIIIHNKVCKYISITKFYVYYTNLSQGII